ncbi:MAG: hypothetical protein AAB444_02780 [Patescibacteria group bacterium]
MKKTALKLFPPMAAFALAMAVAPTAFGVTFNPPPGANSITPCVALTPGKAGNTVRWTRDSKVTPHMAINAINSCVMLLTNGNFCAAEFDSENKIVGKVECKYYHVHRKAKVAKAASASAQPAYTPKLVGSPDGKSTHQVLEGFTCEPGTPGTSGKPTWECKPMAIDIIGEHIALAKQVDDLKEDYEAFKEKGFPVEYAIFGDEVKLVQAKGVCSKWAVDKATGAQTCKETEKEYELLMTESDTKDYVNGQFAAREGHFKLGAAMTLTRFGFGVGGEVGGETPVGKGSAQFEYGVHLGLGPNQGLGLGLHLGPQWAANEWLDLGFAFMALAEVGTGGALDYVTVGGGLTAEAHVNESGALFLRIGPSADLVKENGAMDSRPGLVSALGFNLTF